MPLQISFAFLSPGVGGSSDDLRRCLGVERAKPLGEGAVRVQWARSPETLWRLRVFLGRAQSGDDGTGWSRSFREWWSCTLTL